MAWKRIPERVWVHSIRVSGQVFSLGSLFFRDVFKSSLATNNMKTDWDGIPSLLEENSTLGVFLSLLRKLIKTSYFKQVKKNDILLLIEKQLLRVWEWIQYNFLSCLSQLSPYTLMDMLSCVFRHFRQSTCLLTPSSSSHQFKNNMKINKSNAFFSHMMGGYIFLHRTPTFHFPIKRILAPVPLKDSFRTLPENWC